MLVSKPFLAQLTSPSLTQFCSWRNQKQNVLWIRRKSIRQRKRFKTTKQRISTKKGRKLIFSWTSTFWLLKETRHFDYWNKTVLCLGMDGRHICFKREQISYWVARDFHPKVQVVTRLGKVHRCSYEKEEKKKVIFWLYPPYSAHETC